MHQTYWDEACARGLPEQGHLLIVDISDQVLHLYTAHQWQQSNPISTSRFGPGEQVNSYQTPRGWHRCADFIGDGEPLGRLFQHHLPQDRIITTFDSPDCSDFILTRIIRLRGLEPGRNQGGQCDSYARYIYIHGTNQEHLLGTPSSHGCIRMSNADIVKLFDQIKNKPCFALIR